MDPNQEVSNFLSHYGRKGMKWGVRKNRQPPSADHEFVRQLRKKKAKHLTNEELRKINERSNLESNFKRSNPGRLTRGVDRFSDTGKTVEKGHKAAEKFILAGGFALGLARTKAGQKVISKGSKKAAKIILKQGSKIVISEGQSFI